jgi:hypothetical protein
MNSGDWGQGVGEAAPGSRVDPQLERESLAYTERTSGRERHVMEEFGRGDSNSQIC